MGVLLTGALARIPFMGACGGVSSKGRRWCVL